MKQVILARPMLGVGDNPIVPDAMADQMVESGAALSATPWPAIPTFPAVRAPQKPKRPVVQPSRPAGQLDLRVAR